MLLHSLYVTHSVSEVVRLISQILSTREGKLTSIGLTNDVMSKPELIPELGNRTASFVLWRVT